MLIFFVFVYLHTHTHTHTHTYIYLSGLEGAWLYWQNHDEATLSGGVNSKINTFLPTPLLRQDMTPGQFFKWSLTGFDSEFSFS